MVDLDFKIAELGPDFLVELLLKGPVPVLCDVRLISCHLELEVCDPSDGFEDRLLTVGRKTGGDVTRETLDADERIEVRVGALNCLVATIDVDCDTPLAGMRTATQIPFMMAVDVPVDLCKTQSPVP